MSVEIGLDRPASDSASLLLEIARCPVMLRQLAEPRVSQDCTVVIRAQDPPSPADHQLPEPWSGNLAQAPILFVSSNPSISTSERYPRLSWDESLIDDFFTHRFGRGREPWVDGGLRALRADGTHEPGWVRFWAGARARASELLGRAATPGDDYALTEVVHCKSSAEEGVHEAMTYCADRYLARVVAVSGARVLVCLGAVADAAVRRVFHLPTSGRLHGPVAANGKDCFVAFLPHPNAFQPKTFAACLAPADLVRLRMVLP